MKAYEIQQFGIADLTMVDRPDPEPGPGQVLLAMKAWSLNYRDLLVAGGRYNPKLKFPMVPLSDGVGEVLAVGDGVTRVKTGDRVAGIFMQNWIIGPFQDSYAKSAMGGAIDGVLAEKVGATIKYRWKNEPDDDIQYDESNNDQITDILFHADSSMIIAHLIHVKLCEYQTRAGS